MQPVITCVVCGTQTSKRQSLAFKNGRACRDHEEVKSFIANQEQEKRNAIETSKRIEQRLNDAEEKRRKDKETEKSINEVFTLLNLVSFVKVQHSIYGHSPEDIYSHIALFKGKEMADKVREEVDKDGGPWIDPAQLVADAMYFKKMMEEKTS